MNATENNYNEATLDENWLHQLACVANSFMKGESLHEETLSKDVNEDLVSIFGKFKEDKLNLQQLKFDDPEVEAIVHAMPKLTKKLLKKAKIELETHLQSRASMAFE